MYWFYLADIPKKKILLNQEESKHITKVLRYGIGDTVYLNDGKGSVYQ
ncbi:MAG TPA: 16S rRNA (uracil(1498)-N(3))-methyltransferase, partial [Flavobacteriales bacterium]|nr:16S rRNA (uracil(1498)-N(3))-methyltransferase [Flavobacteriales bacterium]